MIYDENCFERWSERMEQDYLSQDFDAHEDDTHRCSGHCDNEATEQIGRDWYCEECASNIED